MGGHIIKKNFNDIKGTITSYLYTKYTGTSDWNKKENVMHEFSNDEIIKKTITVNDKFQKTMIVNHIDQIIRQLKMHASYCHATKNEKFIVGGHPKIAFSPDAYLSNSYVPINIKFKHSEQTFNRDKNSKNIQKREARIMLFEIYAARELKNKKVNKFIKVLVSPNDLKNIVIKEYPLDKIERVIGPLRRITEDIKEIQSKYNLYSQAK